MCYTTWADRRGEKTHPAVLLSHAMFLPCYYSLMHVFHIHVATNPRMHRRSHPPNRTYLIPANQRLPRIPAAQPAPPSDPATTHRPDQPRSPRPATLSRPTASSSISPPPCTPPTRLPQRPHPPRSPCPHVRLQHVSHNVYYLFSAHTHTKIARPRYWTGGDSGRQHTD